jgi:hypothetical protein
LGPGYQELTSSLAILARWLRASVDFKPSFRRQWFGTAANELGRARDFFRNLATQVEKVH